jgi:hypothetical protein
MSQEFFRHFKQKPSLAHSNTLPPYWCQRVELSNYSDVSQASWFEAVVWLLAKHRAIVVARPFS